MRSAQTMKQSKRRIIATLLTLIFLMISFSPLGFLALQSTTFAHALTGECSGDCTICGCSAESMATHTCCCSKKKQQLANLHEDEHDSTLVCCNKAPGKKKIVIVSCGTPCGSNKAIALSGGANSELVPFYFTERILIPHAGAYDSTYPIFLISRHLEPPDPPPRQA